MRAITHVTSFTDLLSKDSTAELLTLRIDRSEASQSGAVPTIRTVATTALPDGLIAQVTGAPAFTADLTQVFKGADRRLLLATVLVVALLLVVTYRSPWLWLVPLTVVAASERVAAHLVGQIAPHFGVSVDGQVSGITSVLVFGAATDYALLLIALSRRTAHSGDSRPRHARLGSTIGRTDLRVSHHGRVGFEHLVAGAAGRTSALFACRERSEFWWRWSLDWSRHRQPWSSSGGACSGHVSPA